MTAGGGDIRVRAAESTDCPALGIVGPAAYAAAYGDYWSDPAELARHLETFGAAAAADFLARPGAAIWLAEADGIPVGFLSLLLDSPDPVERRPGGAEIPRIFLLPGARGRGIGQRLLAPALEAARTAGSAYVWLDAMDSAHWAIAAYRAWGFVSIGTTRFPKPVAPDKAGMVVLRMDLGG